MAYQIEKIDFETLPSARFSIKFAKLRFTATCVSNYFEVQTNQFN